MMISSWLLWERKKVSRSELVLFWTNWQNRTIDKWDMFCYISNNANLAVN